MVIFIQPFTDVLVIEQREPATKRRSLRKQFSLETTLRSELIPGYQAWTSVPELPVPRWEDLINTFQKSNSYHLFKIYIRSQDWYFEARSINFQKQTDQRQTCNPSPTNMASRLYLLRWRRTISLGNCLSYGATVHKSTKLIEFQFLNCYIGAYQLMIFSLKIGRREYFSGKTNLSFFGLAMYYMLHPLFGKAWLTGFKTLFR